MKHRASISSQSHLHISDGKSQTKRLLPALKKGYFSVADMRFHTLLAMVVDYAQVMKFYNLENQQDGVWKPYFSVDETVVIATILATDPDKLVAILNQSRYPSNVSHALIETLRSGLPKEISHQVIAVYIVCKMLDNWLVLLASAQSKAGIALHKLIESVFIGLTKDLKLLAQYVIGFLPDLSVEEIFSQDLITRILEPQEINASDYIDSSALVVDEVSIRSTFYAFVKAIEMVQASAAELLPASLVSKDHDPAIGLLIAFLQLFQKLQHKINRFTLNYIDFYYDDVLKTQTRPCAPDYAYLTMRSGNINNEILLNKGAEFLAGKDENKQDVIFTAVEDVLINNAAVAAIHTLFFDRDYLSSPENNLQELSASAGLTEMQKRQLATGCWLNEMPILTDADADLAQQDKRQSCPLLGAPKVGEESVWVNHARIGFALASKVLFLREGRRTVRITLKYNDLMAGAGKNERTLEQWIKEITVALASSNNSACITSAAEQDTFFKVFRNIFIISLSTEEGWLDVPEYLPSYSGVDSQLEQNSLTITFSLSADTPPITPYDQAVHGEQYETQLPIIKFVINPKGYLYPYGILSKLELAWVQIDVDVEACRTLLLHNNIGQLSSQAPFTPFGPIPEIGSYLIVGCEEAAGKQLTHFNVDIKWGGLPSGIGGFRSYYQGYNKSVENMDFQINTTVLVDGKWLPENTKAIVTSALFKFKPDHDAGDVLSEESLLPCDPVMAYWTPLDYRNQVMKYRYTPSSNKGFFKFTLAAPVGAFGHKDYPNELAQVLTHNAKQKIPQMIKELPNAPYTPMIDSISANYKASAKMTIGHEELNCLPLMQEKIIHLHPMGWKDSVLEADQRLYFLPQYQYSGNLLIGLEGVTKGGLITLYFHLRENSLPVERVHLEELRWFYLSADEWIALNKKQIISDSTQGFMTSGIVTLDVPDDITSDNTIMPRGLFWLSVSADHELEKFCSVFSVYAQAVKVVRSIAKQPTFGSFKQVPSGSITQARQSIPGIVGIRQVQPSFGGRSSEDRAHLRTRVSERLRHKKRALLADDYELLILEQFPQVFKVKCFPNMAPDVAADKYLRPGQLLIVVLPYLTQETQNIQKPLLNGHLVNEVKAFVGKLAPPFVTIHVHNPVYEVIQVRCTVKLKKVSNSGLYINRLNQAISDFLSPWNDTIGYAKHFGWTISEHDIESYIQQLDFIDRVTNFSILRIAPDHDDCFDLFDSAAHLNVYTEFKEVLPKYPWSVLSPIKQHFIEVDDSFDLIEPEITGVGELEIGSTFIVSEEKWREKIEKH
jgi:baseplate J-like protein